MAMEKRETGLAPSGDGDSRAAVKFAFSEVANAFENAQALGKLVTEKFVEGHHFMRLPGMPSNAKPHLCDPGIGLISTGFHVVPSYRVLESRTEDDDEGHLNVVLEVVFKVIGTEMAVAAGVGAASTHEVKYAYRWMPVDQVPVGLDKSLLPRRAGRGGEWLYRVSNPDLGDLYNTVWKMAAKRAEADATLKLPGCSELFAGYAGTEAGSKGTGAKGAATEKQLGLINRLAQAVDPTKAKQWLKDHLGKEAVETSLEASKFIDWLQAEAKGDNKAVDPKLNEEQRESLFR